MGLRQSWIPPRIWTQNPPKKWRISFCPVKVKAFFFLFSQQLGKLRFCSNLIHFAGSLESPLAASQAYHPSSTYFHQECQWFFDPPPARQLILKISTAHKMSKFPISRLNGFGTFTSSSEKELCVRSCFPTYFFLVSTVDQLKFQGCFHSRATRSGRAFFVIFQVSSRETTWPSLDKMPTMHALSCISNHCGYLLWNIGGIEERKGGERTGRRTLLYCHAHVATYLYDLVNFSRRLPHMECHDCHLEQQSSRSDRDSHWPFLSREGCQRIYSERHGT